MKKRTGFTLIEIIIGFSILIVFFFGAYRLFTSGTRTAEKARWTNGAITQLRNFSTQMGLLIRASSRPTTLVEDSLREDSREIWAVKILAAKKKVAASGETAPTTLMQWYACEAERPSVSPYVDGRLTRYELIFNPKHATKADYGDISLISRTRTFRTTGPQYVAANGLAVITNGDTLVRDFVILNDVASISFDLTSLTADEGIPMRISVSCVSPMDPKTHKETDVLVTPNVPIRSL